MTPMPRQPPELPKPRRDSQPTNSNTPPKLSNATDKSKIAQFTTTKKQKKEILITDSENSKERDTRTRTIYYKIYIMKFIHG